MPKNKLLQLKIEELLLIILALQEEVERVRAEIGKIKDKTFLKVVTVGNGCHFY